MANISGTNLAAKIVPFTTDDTYPTHEDIYGIGGLMSVADVSARNLIPSTRRKEGMKVAVISEGITYELKGGITNSYWQSFGPSFFNQITEPILSEKTFVFWKNSTTDQMYIITKINGYQKKAELDHLDLILNEPFDNWSGGLPVGWSNNFNYKPIRGTVTNDSNRVRLDYTGTTNQNMIIAYRDLIPVGVSSIKVIIKIDDITPGGGGCAYTFLEVLTVNSLDISPDGGGESKAYQDPGHDTQFIKAVGTYTFTFPTAGYRNFVLKYKNVDNMAHIHAPPVTCCIDSVIIYKVS